MKLRITILSLCLGGALLMPALALTTSTAEAENAAPIAEDLQLTTYKDVAIFSRFAAVDPEGDLVTFQVVDSPARGQVAVDETDPAAFTYTPYEGKKGKDSFTYVAVDDHGNTSKPAKVKIVIQKQTAVMGYSDMEGDPAHYAALHLAQAGVYTGRRVGSLYCFDPDSAFTREEFLAMAMTAAGKAPLADVTLTGFYDDDDISAWAKGYVSAALMSGTIQGTPEDGQICFSPSAAVTRAEAAVILDRLLQPEEAAADVFAPEAVPAWAGQPAANLRAASVLTGAGRLDANLTRGDAAQLLCAMLEYRDEQKTGWFWA